MVGFWDNNNIDKLIDLKYLSPNARRGAAFDALINTMQQIGRRGDPRLSPTPPPINLNVPSQIYQTALANDLARGQMVKKAESRAAQQRLFGIDPTGTSATTAGLPAINRIPASDSQLRPDMNAPRPILGTDARSFTGPSPKYLARASSPAHVPGANAFDDSTRAMIEWGAARRAPPPEEVTRRLDPSATNTGAWLNAKNYTGYVPPATATAAVPPAAATAAVPPLMRRVSHQPYTNAEAAEMNRTGGLPHRPPPSFMGDLTPTQQAFARNWARYDPPAAMKWVGEQTATRAAPKRYKVIDHEGKRRFMTSADIAAANVAGNPVRWEERGPLVSVQQNAGQKATSALGEVGIATYKSAVKNATIAGPKLFRIREMKNLLSTGVLTGPVSKMTLPIRRLLAEFNAKVGANTGIHEAIESMGKELALGQHGPGMGPMTDADFKIYNSIVPGLGKTAEGNQLIMLRLEREFEGRQILARILREQLQGAGALGGEAIDEQKAWREVAAELNDKYGPLVPTFESYEALQEQKIDYVNRWVMYKDANGKLNPAFVKP